MCKKCRFLANCPPSLPSPPLPDPKTRDAHSWWAAGLTEPPPHCPCRQYPLRNLWRTAPARLPPAVCTSQESGPLSPLSPQPGHPALPPAALCSSFSLQKHLEHEPPPPEPLAFTRFPRPVCLASCQKVPTDSVSVIGTSTLVLKASPEEPLTAPGPRSPHAGQPGILLVAALALSCSRSARCVPWSVPWPQLPHVQPESHR